MKEDKIWVTWFSKIILDTKCLNCGAPIQENFCPKCGQKKGVHKITWKFLFKEITHFFTHLEKAFIRSTLKMWSNPGHFVKTYLNGQRKDKQSPVSFLVVWAAVFYLTRETLVHLFDYKMETINTFSFINEEAALYYFKHVTYLTIVFIPVWAAISWYIGGLFRRINYPEAILIHFYSYSIFFQLLSLITVLCGLIFRMNIMSNTINNVYIVAANMNGLWLNYSIQKAYAVKYKIIRSFAIVIIGSFIMIKFIELITSISK